MVRQNKLITMKKVIAAFKWGWRCPRVYSKQARIKFLRQLTNDPAFSCCVPSFKAHDGRNVRGLGSVLEFPQPLLKLWHRLLVSRLRQTFLEIDFFQQSERPSQLAQFTRAAKAAQSLQPANTGVADSDSIAEVARRRSQKTNPSRFTVSPFLIGMGDRNIGQE